MVERRACEVFEAHLRLANEGRFEEDIEQNFHPDCVVLTAGGVHHGHEGLRNLAKRLGAELPGAKFRYDARHVEGDIAFLAWSAECDNVAVHDGADSFVFREGRIVGQTIHYTLSLRGPTETGQSLTAVA